MTNFFQRVARSVFRRSVNSARIEANKDSNRQDPTWCGREARVRDKLSSKLTGAEIEVSLPRHVGRIDILTPNEVIEVKEVKDWKHAVGQVIVYGNHFPGRKLRVHLFGSIHPRRLGTIERQCAAQGVTMTYEK